MDRLDYLKWCRDEKLSERAFKTHRIYDYMPGHVRYQYGRFPARNPYYPTNDDWKLLDRYAENGIEMIHLWLWNGECGLFGRDVYEPVNKEGVRRFIDECHRRRLKVIPYTSTGYLDMHSPVYRSEWSRSGRKKNDFNYLDLDILCPGSIGWRNYFYSAIERLMDDYGFDGIYWDGGIGLYNPGCFNEKASDHVHFAEIERQDAEQQATNFYANVINPDYVDLWNDFLCGVYARARRRRGFVVAHMSGDNLPPFKDRCWDYQLIGEAKNDILASIDKTKTVAPYIVRFIDWSKLITNYTQKDFTPKLELVPGLEHFAMACCIPYLQFPWLEDGGFGTENVFNVPGVVYQPGDYWMAWAKAQQAKGFNPAMMGGSFVQGRDRFLDYFRVYRQMTEPNTVLYMEIKGKNGDCFPGTDGKRRVSIFVNSFLWVAIANLDEKKQEIKIRPLQGSVSELTVTLNPKTLTVLRYFNLNSLPELIQKSGDSFCVQNTGSVKTYVTGKTDVVAPILE